MKNKFTLFDDEIDHYEAKIDWFDVVCLLTLAAFIGWIVIRTII